jgi:hypothetical protein
MYTMSIWALTKLTLPKFYDAVSGRFSVPVDPVPWAGIVLIALAALMLVEAVLALASGPSRPTPPKPRAIAKADAVVFLLGLLR